MILPCINLTDEPGAYPYHAADTCPGLRRGLCVQATPDIVYDSSLETVAQNYANKCQYAHSVRLKRDVTACAEPSLQPFWRVTHILLINREARVQTCHDVNALYRRTIHNDDLHSLTRDLLDQKSNGSFATT